jgi:hypothetical protein
MDVDQTMERDSEEQRQESNRDLRPTDARRAAVVEAAYILEAVRK